MISIVRKLSRLPLNWILFVVLETFAQIALKLAAVDVGPQSVMQIWFTALLSSHWFQVSIAADIVNFFIWMSILRRHDLSLAVPLSSLSYFTVVVLSTALLHESVTPLQLLGLSAVGIGIILIAGLDDADTDDIANDQIIDVTAAKIDNTKDISQEAMRHGSS